MHLVGFIIRIHHDARSSECQIHKFKSWEKFLHRGFFTYQHEDDDNDNDYDDDNDEMKGEFWNIIQDELGMQILI